MPKVLFIVPYPIGRAPSQRFRVEAFLPFLDEAGIAYTVVPFLDEATGKIIYQPGQTARKALGTVMGFLRRFKTVLLDAPRYDYIFIHREAAPLGPPVFEWMLARLLGKKYIYDFDDAIWIPNTSKENAIADKLKAFWKIGSICQWAWKAAAGNAYLKAYAAQHNPTAPLFLPTCVDVAHRYNRVKQHGPHKPVIGWTGSHSTVHYVDALVPVLQRLQERHNFTFVLIADKKPELPLRDWQFVPWNKDSEIEDLLRLDIGVMPLKPDAWSEGKCGFKLIQYLALGIPAVADPIGVNKDIIEPGKNGYLCQNEAEWEAALEKLILDATLRQQLGLQGKHKMDHQYSIQSQREVFLGLFANNK